MPISQMPSGRVLGVVPYTDGYTSINRANQMPTTEHSAKNAIVGVYFLAATESNPKNGNANPSTAAAIVIDFHGSIKRRRKKCVSSPTFAYQMTRYWAKVT